jgi:(p)ppGpp synthase/HD superfamily hydrolase
MDYLFKPDSWSTDLLNKLKAQNERTERFKGDYEKVDIADIKRGIYFCKKYHEGQMRQSGDPFYSHPITVANYTSDHNFTTDVIISALLHDTVEDTDATCEMIEEWFGPVVARNVEGLTRIKPCGRKMTTAENIDDMYQKDLKDALLVKTCDRIHNLETIGAKKPEKQKKIVEETLHSIMRIAFYLDNPTLEQQIIEAIAKITLRKQSTYFNMLLLESDSTHVLNQALQNTLSPLYMQNLKVK